MNDWIVIKDATGYEINSVGQVRNIKTRKILKPHLNRPDGYARVNLNGRHRYIHKLMYENLYGYELKDDEMIRHRDGDKSNNRPYNLKIVKKLAHK